LGIGIFLLKEADDYLAPISIPYSAVQFYCSFLEFPLDREAIIEV
jgi:hypothetical protein